MLTSFGYHSVLLSSPVIYCYLLIITDFLAVPESPLGRPSRSVREEDDKIFQLDGN